MNLNWRLRNSETQSHTLSANASYQEAADKQGRYIMPGNLTRFMNLGANYGIDFTPLDFSVIAGINASNNYASRKNVLTIGPTLTCSKHLFKKALTTGLTLSFNQTQEAGKKVGYNL